jgi:hypothetical protein
VTTTRSLRDEVKNVLDYLSNAELTLNTNPVSMSATRVTWHAHKQQTEFLVTREHTYEQYLVWVENGSYSALLRDASLLQISYAVRDGRIVAHRLAYIPCPCIIKQDLLDALLGEGHSIDEIVSLCENPRDVVFRSPIRFDYDAANAKPGHPASHMTINSPDCRIACVAPMHVLRFVDFVYRHFYPKLWGAHASFFAEAAWRHIGNGVIVNDERTHLHLAWDTRATAMAVSSTRPRVRRPRSYQ